MQSPPPLKETVGTELRKATETSSGAFDLSKLGDLIGGVIGGVYEEHRKRLTSNKWTMWSALVVLIGFADETQAAIRFVRCCGTGHTDLLEERTFQ